MSLVVLCGAWLWLVCCLWPQWTMYENYQYGWFVPFMVVALCWKRWRIAPEPEPPKARFLPALIVVVTVIALLPARMIYEANSLWRTISWPLGIPVLTIALCWLYYLGGRAWLRHFSFPVLFFLVALPWPGSFENMVTKPLAALDTRAVTEFLIICGVPAQQSGTTIELASDQVGVDEACSGIRSLHAALMVSLLLGELFFLRPRSRVILLGGGVFLTFVVNIGRTFALSWLCAKGGTAVLNKWHDRVGIAEVVAYLAGLFILALLLRPKRTEVTAARAPRANQASMRLPAPVPAFLCIFVAAWLVFLEAGTRGWFLLRESKTTAAAVWSLVLPPKAKASTNASPGVELAYRADETASAQWAEPDGSLWQLYYMRWLHGSKTSQLATGHWPETCMVNTGKALRGSPETKLYEVHNLKLPFRIYTFDDNGSPLYVFHCVWEERTGPASDFKLGLKVNLASRVEAAWHGKRNLGQQLLEIAILGFKDFDTAETAFIRQIDSLVLVQGPGRGVRSERARAKLQQKSVSELRHDNQS